MNAAAQILESPRLHPFARIAELGRALIPIGILQVAVLYATLAVKPVVGRPDPDFWWHLRTGDEILESGIPRSDTFSWTMHGEKFVAHEWLSEAVIAAVQRALGYWGNIVLFDAVSIAALAIMYALATRLGAGSKTRTILTLVTVAAMLPFVTVRPQAFSWLLFSVFVYFLTVKPRSRRNLIVLPVLMALWANLHLGFLYGLVTVGLFGVSCVVDRLRGREADVRYAAILVALCVAASCANPHGPALLVYPLTYADDREALSLIAEWKSPLTLNPMFFAYHLATIAILGTLWASWKRSTFHALLAVAFILFSFGAGRNIPFVVLLLVPLVGAAFGASGAGPVRTTFVRARIAVPILGAAAVMMLVIGVDLGGGSVAKIGGPNDDGYPHAGAAYAQEHLRDAHLYNHYTWGGYLLLAAPDVPVFIDGRSDFYGGDFIMDWAAIGRLEPGWELLVERYGIDAFFINRGSRLARRLREDARWEEVFTGRTEAIFVRR